MVFFLRDAGAQNGLNHLDCHDNSFTLKPIKVEFVEAMLWMLLFGLGTGQNCKQAIKYGSCLILKILRLQKWERSMTGLRNVFSTLFIIYSNKLKNKFLKKTATEELLFMNT